MAARLAVHTSDAVSSIRQKLTVRRPATDPEIFYGLVRQYGAAGAINLMSSRMDSPVARQAGKRVPIPAPRAGRGV